MSDWSDVVDAVVTDLRANVASLAASGVQVHKYEPWDPGELKPDRSPRHLAVWPDPDRAEEAAPVVEGGPQEKNQRYQVLVWEPSPLEGDRLVRDEAATKRFLDLHNAVRARFYVTANQSLAGSELVWYLSTTFANRAARVRWFRITITVARYEPFT